MGSTCDRPFSSLLYALVLATLRARAPVYSPLTRRPFNSTCYGEVGDLTATVLTVLSVLQALFKFVEPQLQQFRHLV
ncbi:hypothetical protein CIHUM_00280 [Corynebacterium ihumii]|uniref:Secreted protein n=1 Tax=Corynebacterium ihumii TaxID=1232427 RepID=A0ABY7UA09_9CORY|nr:hypothetical protein CIHUM_00280 [Corynebacterium ihumii]